jgi:hypothetical protein
MHLRHRRKYRRLDRQGRFVLHATCAAATGDESLIARAKVIRRKNQGGNVSNSPCGVTENALAHVIGGRTSLSPQRRAGEALSQMEAWAAYCEPSARRNIVQKIS